MIFWLVPDNTVHKWTTSPLFDTRGSLIIDVDIASYSTTIFLLLLSVLLYRWNRGWGQARGRQPHQTASNVGNGNPSRLASSRAWKGAYGKISAVDPTEANLELFHTSFFVIFFPTRMPLTFSWTIPHGAGLLHMALLLLHRQPRHPLGIAIRTLNIRDGRGFGMVQAIRSVERGGFYLMLPTKTNIHSETYLHNHLGYNVTCLTAQPSSAGGSQGGVGLVTR